MVESNVRYGSFAHILTSPRNVRFTPGCKRVSIGRCLTNLVENAVKYGQQAELNIDVSETEIMIHIDDCGPGIPDNLREEAFRPFYRFDGSRSRDSGGTGLGLTVARNVARAHGGDVVLSARAEGGLRATIVLPQNDVPLSSQWLRADDREPKLVSGGPIL